MNTHMNKIRLVIVTAAALSLTLWTVVAGALPVVNGDFQQPSLPTDGQTSSGGPTGWSISSSLVGGLKGVWNPTASAISSEGGGTNQVAFADLTNLNAGAFIKQNLPWTVQNGDVFTVNLRVAADASFPLPHTYGVQFLAAGGLDIVGGTILTNTIPAPSPGQYTNWTIVVKSTGYNAGTQLGIQLYAINYIGPEVKIYFDDVTVSAIPEPATAGLLGLVGCAVLLRLRQR